MGGSVFQLSFHSNIEEAMIAILRAKVSSLQLALDVERSSLDRALSEFAQAQEHELETSYASMLLESVCWRLSVIMTTGERQVYRRRRVVVLITQGWLGKLKVLAGTSNITTMSSTTSWPSHKLGSNQLERSIEH